MNKHPSPPASPGSQPRRLCDLGEDQVLAALLARISPPPPHSGLIGPGDDCAVIPVPDSKSDWLLTSDPVIEGIHFTPGTAPRLIGRKAISRALSDIAAMGGIPKWIIINITSPRELPLALLEQVYDGIHETATEYDSLIVGGDIGNGRDFALHVFAMGQVPHSTAILRSGAAVGDTVFVTGSLGGSQLGHHLTFSPRVREGTWLRTHGWATAMMDISDGISTDIRRMIRASHVGVDLEEDKIPISAAAEQMSDAQSPLHHALNDGEDFELLFTVHRHHVESFTKAWADTFELPCTAIGQITTEPDRLRLIPPQGPPCDWQAHGYIHFTDARNPPS